MNEFTLQKDEYLIHVSDFFDEKRARHRFGVKFYFTSVDFYDPWVNRSQPVLLLYDNLEEANFRDYGNLSNFYLRIGQQLWFIIKKYYYQNLKNAPEFKFTSVEELNRLVGFNLTATGHIDIVLYSYIGEEYLKVKGIWFEPEDFMALKSFIDHIKIIGLSVYVRTSYGYARNILLGIADTDTKVVLDKLSYIFSIIIN
jgi:hypothetical protein